MKFIRDVRSFLVDHPSVVTLTLVVLVIAYWLASRTWFQSFSLSNLTLNIEPAAVPDAISSLAIGIAGVAAMVGGFAGVVVVFGLSSNDERFRQVRVKASTSLRRNWMSIVTTPLLAAFGSIIAATLATARFPNPALWLLLICLLLTAHGAVRLVVLLYELVKVVHKSDEVTLASENGAPIAESVISTQDFYTRTK